MGAKRARNKRPDFEARKDEPAWAAAPAAEAGSRKKLVVNILFGLLILFLIWAVWRKFNPPAPPKVPPKLVEIEKPDWKSAVDGARMWSMLERFLKLGPRVAGTPGSERAQDLIKAELGAAGVSDVRFQKFTDKTPNGDVNFTNVIGVLPGKRKEAIAIAAHYDSKELKEFPFVGANDAASAVVVVFELARQIAQQKDRELTYYFIFFDGEEAFLFDWKSWEDAGNGQDHTYGSRYFVRKMREDDTYQVKTLVLLDMVGDKDYSLANSTDFSPELLSIFVKHSKATFGVDFFIQPHGQMGDDYTPFMEEKIPVIDIIDFEYGPAGNLDYWHTHEDTIDKLSQKSLERTGTLVLAALPDVEKMVLRGLPK
jgi:hypothetical protein